MEQGGNHNHSYAAKLIQFGYDCSTDITYIAQCTRIYGCCYMSQFPCVNCKEWYSVLKWVHAISSCMLRFDNFANVHAFDLLVVGWQAGAQLEAFKSAPRQPGSPALQLIRGCFAGPCTPGSGPNHHHMPGSGPHHPTQLDQAYATHACLDWAHATSTANHSPLPPRSAAAQQLSTPASPLNPLCPLRTHLELPGCPHLSVQGSRILQCS